MGTFKGHVVPGTYFLGYSLYYSVLVSLALLRKQRLVKPPLPRREKCERVWCHLGLVEGSIKLLCPLVSILGELFYPLGVNHLKLIDWEDPHRSFVYKDYWQHITMFGFFLLSGAVDIVSWFCLARQMAPLEQAIEALAFYVLMLLMATHVENKSALEVRVHLLLLVPTCLLALVLTIEVWVPDQPRLWVLKAWMRLVFSSWLLQIGVLLYAPPSGQPWRSENPEDLAFVTIFFTWHLVLGVAILAVIYGLYSLWHHRCSSFIQVSRARYQPCPTDPSGEELLKPRVKAALLSGGV
ncbi:transmembrane epididymal protein 1-like [Echinops telfairi]|uniref:Transmembrane epididymal protein 1-like n=1 Tax=Echinops telfairi TaxID=9371 RepID=A0ABM0J2S2_ECHTE|nr:transmembrane epididymal protein 1-like [Echinops telfairi]